MDGSPRESVRQDADAAERLLQSEPSAALNSARRALEGILVHVFTIAVGEPGQRPRIEDLLRRLSAEGHIPPSIQVPAHVVQVYGNFASHSTSNDITSEFAQPALLALRWVYQWYVYRYLPGIRADCTDESTHSSVQSDTSLVDGRVRSLCIKAAVRGIRVQDLIRKAEESGIDPGQFRPSLARLRSAGLIEYDASAGEDAIVSLA